MKSTILKICCPGLLLVSLCTQSQAQSAAQYVIASAGANVVVSGTTTIDFTLGEPVIATVGNNPLLTQGFQQPLADVPLPVTLLSFTGEAADGYNRLSWETAGEQNNDRFELERGTDGVRFGLAGTIPSKAPGGNSGARISYTFDDRNLDAPVYFYRLKQVDKDGKATYSPTVRLENQRIGAGDISLFPNPAKDRLHVSVNGRTGMLQVLDISGKTLLKSVQADGQTTSVNLGSLPAGVYMLRFVPDQGAAATLRFTKE